jgi:salicylate hydroxylase
LIHQIPSYPSNCLRFLSSVDPDTGNKFGNKEGHNVPLNVIIVGAGLGGLAAAIALARNKHNVTIYEQAERIAEVHSVITVTSI